MKVQRVFGCLTRSFLRQSIRKQIAKTRTEILFILVSCRIAGAGNPGRSRLLFVSRSEFVFDKSALARERTREKGSRKGKRRCFRTGAHFLSPERPLHSFSTLDSKTFYLCISSFSYLCLCLSFGRSPYVCPFPFPPLFLCRRWCLHLCKLKMFSKKH